MANELAEFSNKYAQYNGKVVWIPSSGPPPPPADAIQLTPVEVNLTAGPYATEALCVVDCSLGANPGNWTAAILTGGDFITLDTASGLDGYSIYLTVDQNLGTNPRQGSLDVSCGTAQATFSICQDGTMILCTDL